MLLEISGEITPERMKEWSQTKPLYMLSTGDPPPNKGHIQAESEGLERYSTQLETKRKQE